MANDDPSGAVDNDFDDAATDAEESLRKNLAEYPATIRPGDVVIDLVEGRPLYVRRRKGTAIDVFERESFDLTTYKAHPWLPITPHDDVFECVFLPTKPGDIPSKKKTNVYSYPRGRLARVAVEWLYDEDTHRHEEAIIDFLAEMFDVDTEDGFDQDLLSVAAAAFGHDTATVAAEMAGVDHNYGDDPKGSTAEDGEDDAGLGDFDDYDG